MVNKGSGRAPLKVFTLIELLRSLYFTTTSKIVLLTGFIDSNICEFRRFVSMSNATCSSIRYIFIIMRNFFMFYGHFILCTNIRVKIAMDTELTALGRSVDRAMV